MTELTARATSPSCRPCIHGANCTRTCCNLVMVTYGTHSKRRQRGSSIKKFNAETQANTSSEENTSSSDDCTHQQKEGVDQVDACLNQSSKHGLGKSSSFDISPYREKPANSWNYSPPFSLDSSTESNRHSRSMPEGLHSKPITSSPLENLKSERKKHSDFYTAESATRTTKSHGNSSGNNSFLWIVLCVCIMAVGVIFNFNWNTSEEKYTDEHFERDLEDLSHEFNIKFDPVRLQAGIHATFEREDTSSVIFLYKYLDENKVKTFVREVAVKSARFLRNDTASPIIVKNNDLDMQTSKELLEKYRKKLTDEGVVIFQDLEDIPVNLAMAFHYYCDEYDPLSKKTAVFFTLNMEKCKNFVDDGARVGSIGDVEECLKNKWSDLGGERLPPLLSRVINIVINLEAK